MRGKEGSETGASKRNFREDHWRDLSGGDNGERLRLMSRRITRSAVWWRAGECTKVNGGLEL